MRGKLEEVEDQLRKGRVKGRLNELWALPGAVNASIERGRGDRVGEWAVVDDEGLGQITQVVFFSFFPFVFIRFEPDSRCGFFRSFRSSRRG